MNWKTWLLLFVALVTGGAAALGVKSIFFVESEEGVEEVAVAPGAKTQILVANVDLPAGSELNAQNVRLTLAPENEIPREMQPLSFSEAVGALTSRDLKAGEPISLFDVAATEESASPEETYVKPGYAIVPIAVQTATKAGGGRDFLKTTKLDKMLKPGDVVDLAVVKEDKSVATSALSVAPRRRLTTETIVEGVEVFSVADASRFSQETGAAERASTVCVQLSKEQLAAALKAAEQGRVKIIPRADQAEFETGSSDAPLALDGSFDGGAAFEPPMNADFSFSGLTEETTAPQIVENEAPNAAKVEDADANDSVPFEIATEEETPVVDEESETNSEKTTPFRLRNASVRSESADAEEAEDEEKVEETPDGAAAPLAPTKEPRQAFVAPYRESVVESSVADEANVESASTDAPKAFKYVSPFVTVNPKKVPASVAPVRRVGAFSR